MLKKYYVNVYMSSARHGTASASFKLTCLACAHSFWKVVFRRLQAAPGLYGMVAVPDKTNVLHPVVGRFTQEPTVRIVQPAEVLGTLPWTLRIILLVVCG
jgi:hypothetical protein